MASLWDTIFGGGDASAKDQTASTTSPSSPGFFSDATGDYLGRLINPATVDAYKRARAEQTLIGLGQGILSVPSSRLPIPFGYPFGKGFEGALQAQAGLSNEALQGAQTQDAVTNTALKAAQARQILQKMGLIEQLMKEEASPTAANQNTPSSTTTKPLDLTAPKITASTTADDTMEPEQRALLDTIAGPESGGAYNARWKGKTFADLSQHPNIPEPGPQGPSTAAGRYQIVHSTFAPLAEQYGYTDFQPVTQDKAAWQLASDTYAKNTGRDLLTDLKAGRTQDVGSALAGQWATLSRAMPAYAANLNKYTTNTLAAVPDFSGRMTGSEGAPYQPASAGAGGDETAAAVTPAKPQQPGYTLGAPAPFTPAAGEITVPGKPGVAIDGKWYPSVRDWNLDSDRRADDASKAALGLLDKAAPVAPQASGSLTPPAGIIPTAQAGGPIAPVQLAQLAQSAAPVAPQQQQVASPPGATIPTPAEIAAANRRIKLHTFAGIPVNPADVEIAKYPVAIAVEAEKARFAADQDIRKSGPIAEAQKQAEANNAQRIAAGTAAGKADWEMMSPAPVINGIRVPMTVGDYKRLVQTGQQTAPAAVPAAPLVAAPAPVAPAPAVVPPRTETIPGTNFGIGAAGLRSAFGLPPTPAAPGSGTPLPTAAPAATPAAQSGPPPLGERVIDPLTTYDLSPKIGTGPGQDQPKVSPPDSPYYFVNPPLTAQDPIRVIGGDTKGLVEDWRKTNAKMADAQQGLQVSRQLLTTMADIFRNKVEGGSFTQGLAEKAAALRAIGIVPSGNDPGEVQQLIKDNFAASLATMKATGLTRWTQQELKSTSENFANPNLQPVASFNIIAQDLGKLNQADALTQAWSIAKRDGWQDPNSFAEKWYARPENGLQRFVDQAKAQIGPFKGMTTDQIVQNLPKANSQAELDSLHLNPGNYFVTADKKVHRVGG